VKNRVLADCAFFHAPVCLSRGGAAQPAASSINVVSNAF
jgi:hypothetical protein